MYAGGIMTKVSVSILDKDGNIKLAKSDFEWVVMTYKGEYHEGDKIVVETSPKTFIQARLEDSFEPALLYLESGYLEFTIPFGDRTRVYNSDKAFQGGQHFIWVRLARDYELTQYGNLAANPYLQEEQKGVFPCVTSTITAGNIRFAPRNVVDGYFDTSAHGSFPYTSWSNATKTDAKLTIEFGREVEVDKVILYLRADFPHDSWWQEVTLQFSNGEQLTAQLERSGRPQEICFEPQKITSLTLTNLVKGNEPAPYTALSQLEVLGKNI